MRRLGLFLLLASCSYEKTEQEAPHWDTEPIPRDRDIDAGRDASRPRLDARTPLDAAKPADAGPVLPCNQGGCGLPTESCISDDDCCQPYNYPRGFVACVDNHCASASQTEPTQWNPPLPFCFQDGGAPPPGEGISSLSRCNAASCLPELSPCNADSDCCQPANQPFSFAVCPAARRFCTITNRTTGELAPQCLPDGGLPEPLDSGPQCSPRGERCNTNADCCGSRDVMRTVCLAGFCDKLAI